MRGLTHCLSEEGKALLVQVLLAEVAKCARALVPPPPQPPDKQPVKPAAAAAAAAAALPDLRQAAVVTCAVHALASLYSDMGAGAPSAETWDMLQQLAGAGWTPTRVAVAQCLAAMGAKSPHLLLPSIRRLLPALLAEASLAQGMRGAAAVQGMCMALVSTAMTAREHTHGLPCELLDSFMSVANMLLKESARASADSEVLCCCVEGGWWLISVCVRCGGEWVEGYLPLLLKLSTDFLPANVGEQLAPADGAASSNSEWARAMLGAAGALTALRTLLVEHAHLLQGQPARARHISLLLARALHSDLVVKSAKVAADTRHRAAASPALSALTTALADVLKLRLLEFAAAAPQAVLLPDARAAILKRALQVVARAPGKRGATSTLGNELVNPDDDLLLPHDLDRPPGSRARRCRCRWRCRCRC
jgi:hypothetical protein